MNSTIETATIKQFPSTFVLDPPERFISFKLSKASIIDLNVSIDGAATQSVSTVVTHVVKVSSKS